jgi:hypothetical protein
LWAGGGWPFPCAMPVVFVCVIFVKILRLGIWLYKEKGRCTQLIIRYCCRRGTTAHTTRAHSDLLRTACAPTSTHSNGFCVIWVCISSSSSSRDHWRVCACCQCAKPNLEAKSALGSFFLTDASGQPIPRVQPAVTGGALVSLLWGFSGLLYISSMVFYGY